MKIRINKSQILIFIQIALVPLDALTEKIFRYASLYASFVVIDDFTEKLCSPISGEFCLGKHKHSDFATSLSRSVPRTMLPTRSAVWILQLLLRSVV